MIILASASPRRREILGTLGITFEVAPSDVDEAPRAGEVPRELALRLARAKALAVARDAFVIGADTIVVEGGAILNKPVDDDDARTMIARLAGRWHEVITAVAIARGELLDAMAVTTRVQVAPLSVAQIDAYVATGEGRDKAGAYAVQGIFAGAIERIDGSYSNVVGLPAMETVALLIKHGAIMRWP